MKLAVSLACLVLLAGCGGTTASLAQPSAAPTSTPSPAPAPMLTVPYFDSPEAAMQYLASAWNRRDLVELKHVTTPIARDLLEVMRDEAVDLRLTACERNEDRQDYDCTFTHGFPANYQGHRHDAGYAESEEAGTATFVVGPADRSGWYMTVLESCG